MWEVCKVIFLRISPMCIMHTREFTEPYCGRRTGAQCVAGALLTTQLGASACLTTTSDLRRPYTGCRRTRRRFFLSAFSAWDFYGEEKPRFAPAGRPLRDATIKKAATGS